MAVDGATRLRRNANRLATFGGHEDRFHARAGKGSAACGAGVLGERKQVTHRAIRGLITARDSRDADAGFALQTRTERSREVGHRREIAATLRVERMIELRTPVSGLA